jgi:formylglycine-generating enzyme required for sulfatase activity
LSHRLRVRFPYLDRLKGDHNPQGPAGEFQDPYTTKVTRGGQFDFYYGAATTSNRDDEYYHEGWYTLGFRCAGSVGQ